MMKAEFEQLVNCTATEGQYRSIEKAYNYFETLFSDKQDIVLFYHAFGMDGIDRLNSESDRFEGLKAIMKKEVSAEHEMYLYTHKKHSALFSFSLSVLSTLRLMVYQYMDKSEIGVLEVSEVLDSFDSFLFDNINKLSREDYSA